MNTVKTTGLRKLSLSFLIIALMFVAVNTHAQENPQPTVNYYQPKEMESITVATKTINKLLNPRLFWLEDGAGNSLEFKKAIAFDDRIELFFGSETQTIEYSKLFGDGEIKLLVYKYPPVFSTTYKKYISSYNEKFSGLYGLRIKPRNITIVDGMPVNGTKLADAFYTLQKKLHPQHFNERLEALKPLAEEYNALKTKPTPSEEQRKYVVQATFLAKQKKYSSAVELYAKALKMDSTSFPIVYYNLANLYEDEHSYNAAIFYMKAYLMLGPDSSTARAAQDKIYQWETMVNPEDRQ